MRVKLAQNSLAGHKPVTGSLVSGNQKVLNKSLQSE